MPLTSRIIARLDVKGPCQVVPIQREGLRVLGQPDAFALKYEAEGADELIFLDLVASLYQRQFQVDIIRRVSERVFIPLTVGGGVRSVEDARTLLLNGADKIALNTAAIQRPTLITELAGQFGSQAVVVLVEVRWRRPERQEGPEWEPLTDNARETTGLDALTWLSKAASLGAGEALVISIDQDGSGGGMDLELVQAIAGLHLDIPVIMSGGCGTPEDVLSGFQAGADAVAAGSMFGYYYSDQVGSDQVGEHKGTEGEGNWEWRRGERGGKPFPGAGIRAVKEYLAGKVMVRL